MVSNDKRTGEFRSMSSNIRMVLNIRKVRRSIWEKRATTASQRRISICAYIYLIPYQICPVITQAPANTFRIRCLCVVLVSVIGDWGLEGSIRSTKRNGQTPSMEAAPLPYRPTSSMLFSDFSRPFGGRKEEIPNKHSSANFPYECIVWEWLPSLRSPRLFILVSDCTVPFSLLFLPSTTFARSIRG